MAKKEIEKTNSDRMVERNRANVPQPVRAGTGPESLTYQQKTGVYVENDPANKPVGTPDVPQPVPEQPAYKRTIEKDKNSPTED